MLSYLGFDNEVYLPQLDDGISAAISVPDGIPFGTSHPMRAWVRNCSILAIYIFSFLFVHLFVCLLVYFFVFYTVI